MCAIQPNPIYRIKVIPAPVARMIIDRYSSLACLIRIANTATLSGRIQGATTMAPMTTAELLASNPKLAIKLAPIVRTMKNSLSRASQS